MLTEFFKLPTSTQIGLGATATGLFSFVATGIHFLRTKSSIYYRMMQTSLNCNLEEGQQISSECYEEAYNLYLSIAEKLEPEYYPYYAACGALFVTGLTLTVYGICSNDHTEKKAKIS